MSPPRVGYEGAVAADADHLDVLPEAQGRGIGAAVVADVLADADARRLPVRVGALRGSAASRFYQRQGFEHVGTTEWDEHSLRTPLA